MTQFKPTSLATLPSIIEPLSEAASYWQQNLDAAKVAKELHSINYIDINASHDILVSSSTRVAIYEYYSLEVKKTFTTASYSPLFGATFRKTDDRLIAAGSSDGVVRVWDTRHNKPLRLLGEKNKERRHKAAVCRCHFFGSTQIASFSDDKSIKLWDMTEETVLATMGPHEVSHRDYIRAGLVIDNLSMIISGSYDKSVKMWDVRAPQKPVIELDHEAPVEALTVRNLVAISAGGDRIKVFDIVAGKVFKTLVKTHHKAITCVCNHGSYLVSGSIDGHAKVFDSNFNVAASLTFAPAQLLSCALDDKILAVGSNDGLLSVNQFKNKEDKNISKSFGRRSRKRYFHQTTADDLMDQKDGDDVRDRIVVKNTMNKRGKILSKEDKLLKSYNHSLALDTAIKSNKDRPEKVVSFMQELIRRGALRLSLAGRGDKTLKLIIDFLIKEIPDPKYNRILVDVALILTEVYKHHINRSQTIQLLFTKLKSVIDSEVTSMQQMLIVAGSIKSIINQSIK